MSAVRQAYVALARNAMRLPPVARYFDRAVEGGSDFERWFASLFAIYQLDRMIALDIPWWNVEATEEVTAFLAARPQARVFEFGSGASSAWLAKRCGALTTVEHDRDWGENVAALLAGNPHCRLLNRPIAGGAYVRAITEVDGPFDLIVVDGRERALCLEAAIPALAPGGMILFDDSGRQRYRAAIEASGLEEGHHFGRSYCVPYPDHTSILRRPATR